MKSPFLASVEIRSVSLEEQPIKDTDTGATKVGYSLSLGCELQPQGQACTVKMFSWEPIPPPPAHIVRGSVVTVEMTGLEYSPKSQTWIIKTRTVPQV